MFGRLFDLNAEPASSSGPQEYSLAIATDSQLHSDSQRLQLQAILDAVSSLQWSREMRINNLLCLYHTGRHSLLEDLGFWDYEHGQAELQSSSRSILFYANDNLNGLKEAFEYFIKIFKATGAKSGGTHVVVMPCWQGLQVSLHRVEQVFSQVMQDRGVLKGVYATAPAEQCSIQARDGSVSGNEASDSEGDANKQQTPEGTIRLRPHLVIPFSYGKRRRDSDASQDRTLKAERSFSVTGGSGAAVPSPSPSSAFASPGSPLPSIQEQASCTWHIVVSLEVPNRPSALTNCKLSHEC